MDERKVFFTKFEAVPPEQGNSADMSDVSLLSVGPAIGHGLDIDEKSLQTAFEAVSGRSVKSYNNHGWCPAPTDIIGTFSGVYIDAAAGKLKARNFNFLKTADAGVRERLLELAQTHPDVFGTSLNADLFAVWVMDDGSEVPFSPQRPEGCSRENPCARFTRIWSADFVSDPAANAGGLFNAEPRGGEAFNENQKTRNKQMKKALELFAKRFGAGTPKYALAAAKFAEGEAEEKKPVAEEIADEVEREDEIKVLKDEIDTLKKSVEELSGKLEAAEEGKKTAEAEKKAAEEKAEELAAKFAKFGGAENFSTGGSGKDGPGDDEFEAKMAAAQKSGDTKEIRRLLSVKINKKG